MTILLKSALAGFLMAAVQNKDVVVLDHDRSPKYNRTDYESACGTAVFSVRFRNGPDGYGHVDHLRVDGRAVPGAADALELRAARRVIERIGIMNCGMDERRPVFRGVMKLSEMDSRRLGMRASHFFRLIREGRQGWQVVFDSPLPQDAHGRSRSSGACRATTSNAVSATRCSSDHPELVEGALYALAQTLGASQVEMVRED